MREQLKGLAIICLFAIVLSTPFAWITHVYTCLYEGRWGFLVAGALAAPVGIIHGWGIWFGWW